MLALPSTLNVWRGIRTYCTHTVHNTQYTQTNEQEEKTSWQLLDEEERPKFVPQGFDSLRAVPMYSDFIKEQFERCLDLYLCPRVCLNGV